MGYFVICCLNLCWQSNMQFSYTTLCPSCFMQVHPLKHFGLAPANGFKQLVQNMHCTNAEKSRPITSEMAERNVTHVQFSVNLLFPVYLALKHKSLIFYDCSYASQALFITVLTSRFLKYRLNNSSKLPMCPSCAWAHDTR